MQPYNYITYKPDYYTFVTAYKYEYHCYFYDFSAAFSEYPELAPKVFGFNLDLVFKPEGLTRVPPDPGIAVTVTNILKTFLSKNENAVIYICDYSDNREKARFYTFTNWFRRFNDGSVVHLKGMIRAGETTILNAMLINRENPLLNDFIEAYEILTGIYTKPDNDYLDNILNDGDW
ncbi:DUF6169 family protein [Niabella drilacis]|uniref:DUF6169 family protein n=1 Tax=Niabella drilacis (strain DSM 25811 / CCM 8410 / CCUG 62505 / LMG 26954 / E90) TaxID=1285928 RepID=UPI000B87D8D9|nr:DUF6169 family protein [Niabella drilacis]